MTHYNFRGLDDKEFESLCADLLGKAEAIRFERFKRGRDNGVDARCFRVDGTEVVLQCKHRLLTALSQLIRHLRDDERPKVDLLQPARYILCVSNPLSREDKIKISEAMSPHLRNQNDIFGAEDLNDLLDRHPDVVQRHYKLWLSSTAVLSLILEKPIFERSAFTLDEALDAAKTYVPTSSYDSAWDKLERHNVLIISGQPGAGKTSLAEHLALRYVAAEYQFFKISEQIQEAESVYASGTRQLFYFDDFLGQNYLEALTGHEGNHITNFIRRIRKDPSKRLILTSRTTILNQGKTLIDSFEHQNLTRSELELNISEYSELEKARILYGHLWHSALTPQYIDEILSNRRYRALISHRNFNPRLVSFITNHDRVGDKPESDYWRYVTQTFNDPAKIWEHPYIAQLDDFGRAVVLLVALNGRVISQTVLSAAYARFVALPQNQSMSGRRDFNTTLRHLTGSFLIRRLEQDNTEAVVEVAVFNPSIRDFVLGRYASDTSELKSGFMCLRSLSSLRVLEDMFRHKFIDGSVHADIVLSILSDARNAQYASYGVGYISLVLSRVIHRNSPIDTVHPVLTESLAFIEAGETPKQHLYVAEVFVWAMDRGMISGARAIKLIDDALRIGPDDDELRMLIRVCNLIPAKTPKRDEAEALLEECVLTHVGETLDELIDHGSVFRHLDPYDEEGAFEAVEEQVSSHLLTAYGIDCSASDITRISSTYDFEKHRDDYFGSRRYQRGPTRVASRDPSVSIDDLDDIDDVDDLFDSA
jgi:adenylate kinase family enzyme